MLPSNLCSPLAGYHVKIANWAHHILSHERRSRCCETKRTWYHDAVTAGQWTWWQMWRWGDCHWCSNNPNVLRAATPGHAVVWFGTSHMHRKNPTMAVSNRLHVETSLRCCWDSTVMPANSWQFDGWSVSEPILPRLHIISNQWNTLHPDQRQYPKASSRHRSAKSADVSLRPPRASRIHVGKHAHHAPQMMFPSWIGVYQINIDPGKPAAEVSQT